MTADVAETGDEQKTEDFAGRVFGLYTSGLLTYMVDIGHRTDLFEAAALGPPTSDEHREEAAALGLSNVSFDVLDVAALPIDPGFGAAFAFDAIYNQADRMRSFVGSRRRWCLAGGSSWSTPRRRARSRTTSATRWHHCCTRSAPCTA